MSKEEKLLSAKSKLMAALGDKQSVYLNNLKQWFSQRLNWEELDTECRKLLVPQTVHLHNEFFRALLNKVDTFTPNHPNHSSSSLSGGQSIGGASTKQPPTIGSSIHDLLTSKNSRKRKQRSSRPPLSDRVTFEPAEMFDYLPDDNPDTVRPPASASGGSPPPIPPQRFAAQELLLPDAGLVMGRLLVGAWETGLVNAEDAAAEYIVSGVQVLLKNIITAILLKKKHHRVTCGGTFFYDVGHPMKDPFLRSTVARQQIDDSVIDVEKPMQGVGNHRIFVDDLTAVSACESLENPTRRRITVNDIFNVLRDKNIIPSHSIQCINLERLAQCHQ